MRSSISDKVKRFTNNSGGSNNPDTTGNPDATGDPNNIDYAGAFKELKEALLGDEQQRLRVVEQHVLDQKAFARGVAQVMADSIRISARHSDKLVSALQDPLIETTASAARRETLRLSEALAPVIGPSIRRSIADALRGFMESVEVMAVHTFSVQGLRWRIEAFRTGLSFQQVILKHTLRYAVEQVYLIQRPSGLLILHRHRLPDGEREIDKDAVAAMMLAIQQFSKDAAFTASADAVEKIEMGEQTLWLATGEAALLACLISGTPTRELRVQIKDTLDDIHALYYEPIKSFQGDPASLPDLTPSVQPLLRTESGEPGERKGKHTGVIWGLVLLLLLVPPGYWSVQGFLQHRTLARLETVLRATPGVFVAEVLKHEDEFVARGMADPLAYDRGRIEQQAGLPPGSLRLEFAPFISLEPELVLTRARWVLQPPAGVSVDGSGRTLVMRGIAGYEWIQRAKILAPGLPYFDTVDTASLTDVESRNIAALLKKINGVRIYFGNDAEPLPEMTPPLREAAIWLQALVIDAQTLRRHARLVLTGHTDGTGSAAFNERLGNQRAARVKTERETLGVRGMAFEFRAPVLGDPGADPEKRRVDLLAEVIPSTQARPASTR